MICPPDLPFPELLAWYGKQTLAAGLVIGALISLSVVPYALFSYRKRRGP